jgi:hypothetical protein
MIKMLPPNQALKLTEWAWVQFKWLMVGFVFIIQLLVPITMILINLVISMNSFRFQQLESYQRRSLAPVR